MYSCFRLITWCSEVDQPQLDQWLSDWNNLPLILACLADEIVEIRRVAIGILGRVMPYQTGEITSKLRAVVTELLGELATGQDLQVESSLITLRCVIQAAPQAVNPHVEVIAKALKAKMECHESTIVVLSLKAFAALAEVTICESD